MTQVALTGPRRIYRAPSAGHGLFLLRTLFVMLIGITITALASGGLWLLYDHSNYLAFVILGFLVAGIAVPCAIAIPILYPRRRRWKRTPADFGIARWEDVRFAATDDVELSGWFIPPDSKSDGATIILVHGLGGNRGDMLEHAQMLASKGYGVLLFDLRNHGISSGTLTTLGYREAADVRGAFDYLLTRPEPNPERIGLVGYSMGGATVLRAAVSLPQVRALIVESAYTSLQENIAQGMAAKIGLPSFPFAPVMIWLGEMLTGLHIDQIRPIDDVARVAPRAILFVHGVKDKTVNATNSLKLYEAAKGPKGLYLINQAAHTGLALAEPVQFAERITGFLDWSLRGIGRRRVPRPSVG